jgi:hypothetical protein
VPYNSSSNHSNIPFRETHVALNKEEGGSIYTFRRD